MSRGNVWVPRLTEASLKGRCLVLAVVGTCASWGGCSTSTDANLSNRNPRGSTINREPCETSGSQLLELSQDQVAKFDLKDAADTAQKGAGAVGTSACTPTSADDATKGTDQGAAQASTKPSTSSSSKSSASASTGTSTGMKANPSPSPKSPKPGQELFAANCLGARCHTTTGTDISGKSPEAITAAIQQKAVMRNVKVTPEAIKLISEWLIAP